MADQNHPGQFGNRSDTEQQAQKGGQESSGSFGEKNAADPSEVGQEGGRASSGSFAEQNAADPSEAGRRGAEAQPTEAKREGGRNSGQGS
ncbi:stress protein [Brachybacterium paraconglomeratum]